MTPRRPWCASRKLTLRRRRSFPQTRRCCGSFRQPDILRRACSSAEAPTDFLRSPIDPLELKLRILALVARTRRTSEVFRSVLRAGPLSLDRLARSLTVNEVEVPLRRAECAVLEFLLDHSERFVPSKELNRVVLNGSVGGNAARNQVYELRQRLGAAGAPDAIQYLRGRGYRVRWPVAR